MTHTKPMKDSEGVFTTKNISANPCRKCGGQVHYSIWESSCGGYEDAKFECTTCPNKWWVESSDA